MWTVAQRDPLPSPGMHLKRGRYLLAPFKAPSHCPPNANGQPQWHLQTTVTAPNRFSMNSSNRLSTLLGPPLRSLPF